MMDVRETLTIAKKESSTCWMHLTAGKLDLKLLFEQI